MFCGVAARIPELPVIVPQAVQPPSPRPQSVAGLVPPAKPLLPGGMQDIAAALLVY